MNWTSLLIVLGLFFSFGAQAQDSAETLTDTTSATVEVSADQVDEAQDQEAAEQESEQQAVTSATPANVEKIEVTGSYIKRIDTEGPSPVVTVDQEDFNQAGVDTVSDYLRESPLFGGSTDSGNRDGYFRFRGQSAGSTLVLLNGMRIPKLGGQGRGFYAGVEAIPTNVIERVEILKDGSSALYGSDALAGVMNFITRKDYDGAEYSTRINAPEIGVGLQQNHSLAFGKNYARGQWFASAQFVEQRGFTARDAGNFYNDGVQFQPLGNAGQIRGQGGDFQTQNIGCPDPSERCEIDYRDVDHVRDSRQNIGTLLSGQYDVTSDVTVKFVGMFNRRNRTEIGRPFGLNVGRGQGQNPLNPSQVGSSSLKSIVDGVDSFTVERFVPNGDIGARNIDVLQNAYSAQSQVEGYFLDTWKWDVSGSYAYTTEERNHRNGLLSGNGVAQAIAGGYNPASLNRNMGSLDGARVTGQERYEGEQITTRMMMTGELFEMSDLYGTGGPVAIAFGTEGQWESIADSFDQALLAPDLNQTFQDSPDGSRQVTSVFAEMVAYPLNSVEFQAAGRFDQYSDFGGTFNPKFALAYRPSRTILFRTSWGTNFKAPTVGDMIAQDRPTTEDLNFCDPSIPGNNCDEVRTEATRYRDPNLRPQTGTNYNFGTVIQPNRNWTFTIDQWNFEGTNTITAISDGVWNDIFESLGSGAQARQVLNDMGVTYDTDEQGNVVSGSARLPLITNMGSRDIRGLDIGVNFNSPIRLFGRVLNGSFSFDHTHMLAYQDRRAPSLPLSNRRDLEWKNNLSLGLRTRRHNYRVAARTLAGDTGRFSTRTHTEYDFNYNYNLPWWTARLNFGVKNLLNSRPPVDRTQDLVRFDRGFNAYAFQALGRRYYVGYSQTF